MPKVDPLSVRPPPPPPLLGVSYVPGRQKTPWIARLILGPNVSQPASQQSEQARCSRVVVQGGGGVGGSSGGSSSHHCRNRPISSSRRGRRSTWTSVTLLLLLLCPCIADTFSGHLHHEGGG